MSPIPDSIELYCRAAQEYKASDLILHVGEPPVVRVAGSISPMDAPALSLSDLKMLRDHCLVPPEAMDHDASFVSSAGNRFRINFHRHMGAEGAVLRLISSLPPEIDELGVPSGILKEMASRNSGILIVSGPTGSGKSTTLAGLLEWVNRSHERHVVTIEDPVEYVFNRNKSLFTQRAVGLDTPSFAEGLRRSLRQSPDIILLGEIRDSETASVALQASETGHLVLTTLHATDVVEVIERLVAFFPDVERKGHLQILSSQLLGVFCQKLVPAIDGGLALACEYMSNLGLTRQCILNGDLSSLREHLIQADESESLVFLESFLKLVLSGKISEETALLGVPNPQELRRRLRGITSTVD